MEHLARFGLEQDPFRNEPRLDFYFEGAGHAEARQRLARCLHQGKELCLLVGEVGSGTTTLARMLFEELDPECFEAGMLVVSRGVEAAWLRSAIARQLGVEAPSAERAECTRQLFERLVEIQGEGRRAVIAIDEAQGLAGSDALGELAGLLHFEHDEQRLLSAVLVGSSELEAALAAVPGLLARVELRVRLGALDADEARAYVAHRIRVAGGEPAILPPDVVDAIAARAAGLPRRINALADNALFEAHLASRPRVTVADVERAAHDLPWAHAAAPERPEAVPLHLASEPRAGLDLGDPNEDTQSGTGLRPRRGRRDAPGLGLGLGSDGARPGRFDAGPATDLDQAFADSEDGERAFGGHAPRERTFSDHGSGGERAPAPLGSRGDRAWRPAPAAAAAAGEEPPIPDEKELDDLFVDLVEEV